ncbi:chemotaxis protein CheW [Thalassotalea sp. 1_MG-2023]|uniref:chemotaxis protein CheW n=1 Tax=Thalassotalea sp. 1_MG-2023 TaxID=3062680 RepID=UPI0026E127F3|nr:chemotaxis protein CheW [Thalassotalea sp. 1_MG-2023]MDO6426487.1 chemotaxis protein CheW [Thalassotalea sp. 1_MG-2023]
MAAKGKGSLSASKGLMKNYLSELLTEDPVEPILEQKKQLDQLLQQASVTHNVDEKQLDVITSAKSLNKPPEITAKAEIKAKEKTAEPQIKVPATTEEPEAITTRKSKAEFTVKPEKNYRKGAFQAMFFDVAGLIVAVPLIELGGIHNVDKTNSLMGKPAWFKGVMLHRDEKINVVDTAQWIMPEKCNETLINSLNYQYVIMLNNSQWGLLAENLIDTVTLEQDDVKWLTDSTKRPWLAGLIKERMCALIDVDALIKMLSDGANIHQNT